MSFPCANESTKVPAPAIASAHRMPAPHTTRDYRPQDAAALHALFCDAIRVGAADVYTPAECEAWIARAGDAATFAQRLAAAWVRVAEDDVGISGFAAIVEPGHLDLLFTAPRAARQGVAGLLLEDMLFLAGAMGAKVLTVDASRVARPFLLKHGFTEVSRELRSCGDEALECFRMQGAVPKL